jgi:small conductance mechanosensitive channel
MREKIEQTFIDYSDSLIVLFPSLLTGVIFFLLFVFLGTLSSKLIRLRAKKRNKEPILANFIGGAVRWFLFILGITIFLHSIGFGGIANTFIAGAGVTAIILGFAFKDIAENFIAGGLLAMNRPFKIGDIIEVDKFKGPVKKLDLRSTHIRLADGRDIWIPNSMIVKNVLTNYTRDGLLRQEFLLGLDMNCNVVQARELILNYMENQMDILKEPIPYVVVDELSTFTTNVRVMFWINVLGHKKIGPVIFGETVKGRVMREVRDLLQANGFPFPSYVLEHKLYNEHKPIPIQVVNGKPITNQ